MAASLRLRNCMHMCIEECAIGIEWWDLLVREASGEKKGLRSIGGVGWNDTKSKVDTRVGCFIYFRHKRRAVPRITRVTLREDNRTITKASRFGFPISRTRPSISRDRSVKVECKCHRRTNMLSNIFNIEQRMQRYLSISLFLLNIVVD